MGLDANGTRFLLYAKSLGVDFSRSAMIGRQFLSRITASDMQRNLREFKIEFAEADVVQMFNGDGGYAESLLRFLGAKDIHSFDLSGYERATHLHDMNQEIPISFKGQYSMILDGGTLEHIFNFPIAIRNCMEMLTVGGHYLGITPANNFMGHGFYQFSPELYYSVFSKANGYRIVSMLALEDTPRAEWFSVKNPVSVEDRVTLTNEAPTYLFVLAEKLVDVPIFSRAPQQSDYARLWGQSAPIAGHQLTQSRSRLRQVMGRLLPRPFKVLSRRFRNRWFRPEWRYRTGFDPRFFERMEKARDRRRS